MLKFIFWTLLAINAVLFAYGQGLLGNFRENEREPGRMRNQLGVENIKLVAARPAPPPDAEPAGDAEPVAPPPTPVLVMAKPPAPAPVEPKPEPKPEVKPELVACTLVGNFAPPEARRLEAMLAPLALGQRQTRENVAVPEVTSHIVFIPSAGSKEAADRKAAELKELGITSYFIMNDNSPMKYAISLGVFKSETSAQTLLATLTKQGVVGAKVAGRTSQATKMAYRFRALEPAAKAKVDAVLAKFPEQQARSCK
ncbi:SPOR domain-containing protein [Massilia atriviolacea]|uniref:SPOR domain-containing protein n=1 Tax=Massilia atriviolacea TaxID=2495579 RepID=A0A430HLQ2_9BURK|nr:SPOR domain-containing protein [Massilia atriviolacea]RSZ58430.1 SPOR domain-containing protein [Massilia atriviolacea]